MLIVNLLLTFLWFMLRLNHKGRGNPGMANWYLFLMGMSSSNVLFTIFSIFNL